MWIRGDVKDMFSAIPLGMMMRKIFWKSIIDEVVRNVFKHWSALKKEYCLC